jgi:hypothetical protein
MVSDSELRVELNRFHEQSVRVWSMLEGRDKMYIGSGFRMRRKLAKRALKITNLTWSLERDSIKEYDAP